MRITKYLIDGEEVSEQDFLDIAREGAFNFIDSCIQDNQTFTFEGRRFAAQSWEITEEEYHFINSLNILMEKAQNIFITRNNRGNLFLGYTFNCEDEVVYMPLQDEYFALVEEGDLLTLDEIYDKIGGNYGC